eukprot:403368991
MESSLFYCLNCSSSYNLTSHIPVILDCGDEICLDCYQNKLVQKQDGTYACCFDIEHEIEKREKPVQSRKIINKLKSMDVLRLVCEKHKEYYSEYYCGQCDKIVCFLCSQLDHQTHNGGTLHKVNPENFKEYLTFINPLLDKQLEMITNIKTKFNSNLNQSQILSSIDFITMLNNTKLLLKDFVRQEDLMKLSITHYKLHGQPQEESKQSNEFQGSDRQMIEIDNNPQDKGQISVEPYQQFVQLVNCELVKLKSCTIGAYMKDWDKASFKLLYQGSRDGYAASKFHQLCDNQGPTITFVLSEFGQTFGGYTSVSWNSKDDWKEDKQASTLQKQFFIIQTLWQHSGVVMICN